MYMDDVGYFQPKNQLSGFGSKLKKAVKAPIKVAQKVVQKTPMPKPLRKIAQRPLTMVERRIDKGDTFDPGTTILQRHYGRNKEDRKMRLLRGFRHMDKIQPEHKDGKRVQRILTGDIQNLIEAQADAAEKFGGGWTRKHRELLGPHRKGGPLRRDPVAISYTTPTQSEEVIVTQPIDQTSPQYEQYPASDAYAQAYAYPQLPDNAEFYEADGNGNAAPKSTQNEAATVPPADGKPKMTGAQWLRLGLAALALTQFL